MFKNLKDTLANIEEEHGGDIVFIPSVSEKLLEQVEKELSFKLPEILRYLYTKETNGVQIDNKVIYSVFDKNQKKTLLDNLQRANNPKTSYWFKYKPEVFNDYIVIGADGEICFTIYKHHHLDNPSIYICENSNSKDEVILEKLEMGLEGLIHIMVKNAF